MTTFASRPQHIFISGSRHCGKSSLLAELVLALSHKDIPCAGILSRGLWEDGIRSGFDLIDLRSRTTTPLSRRIPDAAPGEIPFEFLADGWTAARRALQPERCQSAALVAVDEIGPLEMQGKGFAPLLPPVLELPVLHVWVVRSALVDAVAAHWDLSPHVIETQEHGALTRLLAAVSKGLGEQI
ncbi:nucleoside-triphosphatase [Desulfobaculum bizertense]|uniref:nucleoside-triphosphatase n=1 Tax=Desulfobaculum bizertense TaxID=376490 RepID=UPI000999F59E|nr:nucleoside-triphosphatase [Desulfobaculum bizertense]